MIFQIRSISANVDSASFSRILPTESQLQVKRVKFSEIFGIGQVTDRSMRTSLVWCAAVTGYRKPNLAKPSRNSKWWAYASWIINVSRCTASEEKEGIFSLSFVFKFSHVIQCFAGRRGGSRKVHRTLESIFLLGRSKRTGKLHIRQDIVLIPRFAAPHGDSWPIQASSENWRKKKLGFSASWRRDPSLRWKKM